MDISHENKLARLSYLAISHGVKLRKGQKLIIHAPVEAVDMVRCITAGAYGLGVALVTVLYHDERLDSLRARYADKTTLEETPMWLFKGIKEALEDNTARIVITGSNPVLFKYLIPERVAKMKTATTKASRVYMDLISSSKTNWTIVPYAVESWAQEVFPEKNPQDAVKALWDAIFKATRVDREEDAGKLWDNHNASLERWARRLTLYQFDRLHFTGPGTDLVVGLADGHIWRGGRTVCNPSGTDEIWHNPNIPTEEVFTAPHADRVNGYVRSTKPLFNGGSIIDGISMTFKDGIVIEASAEVGNDALQALLSTDEGARHIGEVALVPDDSPISQSGILFKHTLFDENAACHIALGNSYPKTIKDSALKTPEELRALGANKSAIHVDWMIGSKDISVVGITKDGEEIPLLDKGIRTILK